MREITSKDNRIMKLCQQLLSRKYRDKLKRYLIEGENLLREALDGGTPIEAILLRRGSEDVLRRAGGDPEDVGGKPVYRLDEKLFDRIAQTDASQGVMAIVQKPEFSPNTYLKTGGGGNFVVLDRLQDPGNIGTIIRTAEAAGYRMVICLKGTADVYAPKVVRAAAGALFRVPVVLLECEAELITFSRAAGVKLVATCLDADRYYFQEDLRNHVGLIIGNEGNGISQSLLQSADVRIKIPMCGQLESLNASVAAAILMYEAVRGGMGASA